RRRVRCDMASARDAPRREREETTMKVRSDDTQRAPTRSATTEGTASMRARALRTARTTLALALLLWPTTRVLALTAEEVLQLKQAGVSDETIQQMLENERQKNQQQAA